MGLLLISTLAVDGFVFLGYSQTSATFLGDTILGFSFPISVLIYFKGYMKMRNDEIIDSLGLRRKGLSIYTALLGFVMFLAITLLSLAVGALQNIIHMPINTNVSIVLAGSPLWFYVFAAIIEPINEEILFRGFMVPRIGIIISAVIFGILHASYNSTFAIEIIAAIIFGLISGYVYKKTRSLYPSIIAHILVNSLAVIALL